MDLEATIDAREELDAAIQKFITEQNGPGVVCNWVVFTETVRPDDSRLLLIGVSEAMTAWCLRGMTWFGAKLIESFTG
jgi:hypothetical protein